MKISRKHGGVSIILDGDEVALAIDAFLLAHNVRVIGPRTIRVNGDLCEYGDIFVDPLGVVFKDGLSEKRT